MPSPERGHSPRRQRFEPFLAYILVGNLALLALLAWAIASLATGGATPHHSVSALAEPATGIVSER